MKKNVDFFLGLSSTPVLLCRANIFTSAFLNDTLTYGKKKKINSLKNLDPLPYCFFSYLANTLF